MSLSVSSIVFVFNQITEDQNKWRVNIEDRYDNSDQEDNVNRPFWGWDWLGLGGGRSDGEGLQSPLLGVYYLQWY